jgi:hypothetical protein
VRAAQTRYSLGKTGAMTAETTDRWDRQQPVNVQLIGGPTVIIEIGGLRLLTDPGPRTT